MKSSNGVEYVEASLLVAVKKQRQQSFQVPSSQELLSAKILIELHANCLAYLKIAGHKYIGNIASNHRRLCLA